MSSIFSPGRIKSVSQNHRPTRSPKPRFKYVRGELIGKGSYGRVYLGLIAKTGEVMAIKQVELLPVANPEKQKEIVEAFKREIDMLKGLNHDHIVRYFGYEEAPQQLSIFLEYVPGGTIKTCLDKYGRFREDVTKSFTSQILSGLEYLHSKAIIHRDLKADNILLESSGICKISDFGISKQIEDMNDIRAFTGMRGTVQWMAPEIFHSKESGYDTKVDIWSVGCVLLEMWSGELPWSGEDVITVMFKLSQYKQPPVPPNLRLNPLAEQFRLKCFERNPQDRPTAAQLKIHRYLQLPPNWKFPYVMHDRKANRMSGMRSIATLRRSSFNVDPDAPPVPTLKPSVGKNDIDNAEGLMPLQPLNKEVYHNDPIESHSVPVVDAYPDPRAVPPSTLNDGPPVVVITPPGSLKERSFPCDDLETSTKSLNTSERHRQRRVFVVANPDEDGDSDSDNHRKYVFSPPPLPATLHQISSRSYSRGLPSSKLPVVMAANILSPASPSSSQRSESSSSTDSSSLSLTTSHTRTNAGKNKSQTNTFDDSDTDEDLHLWNKPPVDLHKSSKLASASSPALVQPFNPTFRPLDLDTEPCTPTARSNRVTRKSKLHQSTRPHSWLVRPDVQEVLDDLPTFFPDRDVGRAKAHDATSQTASKRQAGEILSPFRRMTKLFRSYSVEAKS